MLVVHAGPSGINPSGGNPHSVIPGVNVPDQRHRRSIQHPVAVLFFASNVHFQEALFIVCDEQVLKTFNRLVSDHSDFVFERHVAHSERNPVRCVVQLHLLPICIEQSNGLKVSDGNPPVGIARIDFGCFEVQYNTAFPTWKSRPQTVI